MESFFPYTFCFWTVKSMYSNISKKLTKWLIDLNVIENESSEIYEYGFSLLISLFFSTLLIILSSLLINRTIETILYLVGFFIVRAICGGYHAKHHYSCFIITMSSYILFLILHYIFYSNPNLSFAVIFFTIVSSVIIILFAPVEHPNNPMTKYRKNKNRLLSIIFSVFICIVNFTFLFSGTDLQYISSFTIGIFLAALAILVAKFEIVILKRKEK